MKKSTLINTNWADIVGTKLDLKESSMTAVETKDAKKVKSKIKAYKLLECSAQTRENLDDVFIGAVKAIISKSKRKGFIKCTIQ